MSTHTVYVGRHRAPSALSDKARRRLTIATLALGAIAIAIVANR